jgi:hypothetical protein
VTGSRFQFGNLARNTQNSRANRCSPVSRKSRLRLVSFGWLKEIPAQAEFGRGTHKNKVNAIVWAALPQRANLRVKRYA